MKLGNSFLVLILFILLGVAPIGRTQSLAIKSTEKQKELVFTAYLRKPDSVIIRDLRKLEKNVNTLYAMNVALTARMKADSVVIANKKKNKNWLKRFWDKIK